MMEVNYQKQSPSHIDPVDATTGMDEERFNDGCSTPDEPETFNRIKAPPICVDDSLKQESMSTEILRQWIFPEDASFPNMETLSDNRNLSSTHSIVKSTNSTSDSNLFPIVTEFSSSASGTHIPVSIISVSSNNSSGDSYTLSSDETSDAKPNCDVRPSDLGTQTPLLQRGASERLNAKILLRKTSRQGRSSQRWVSGSSSAAKINIIDPIALSPTPKAKGEGGNAVAATSNYDPLIRLVTGCVPILKSGKILFVSASRKAAWILPKGGWEQDESMEESAIRESYEEAGCIGTLGPALSSIQYETRKAKKRRVENESLNEKEDVQPKPSSESNSSLIIDAAVDWNSKNSSVLGHENNADDLQSNENVANTALPDQGALTSETMTRIRQLTQNYRGSGHQTDTESMSAGSTLSAAYTHVQMTLFPLYVQKVENNWPEDGRFRKAVDIDDAISMMEERPELQAALIEVRDRKLHLASAAPTDV